MLMFLICNLSFFGTEVIETVFANLYLLADAVVTCSDSVQYSHCKQCVNNNKNNKKIKSTVK